MASIGSTITTPTYNPVWKNPKDYLKRKLKILDEHFLITPTIEQLAHLHTLTNQVQIDNAILSIIDAYYNK